MFKLLLLFVLLPLIELALLSQLLDRTNIVVTIVVVMSTGMVGFQLARRQGMAAWRAIHVAMQSGKAPSTEILNGVMILVAGAFLITPGLLTDIAGFTLLVPRFRIWLGRKCLSWFKNKTVTTFQSGWTTGHPMDSTTTAASTDDEAPSVRVVVPDPAPEDL